jgi:hypothetical protein
MGRNSSGRLAQTTAASRFQVFTSLNAVAIAMHLTMPQYNSRKEVLMRVLTLTLAALACLLVSDYSTAADFYVSKILVKNNSVGDANVRILYDCDQDGDDEIEGKSEEYGCQLGYMKMSGGQSIPAGQQFTIGNSDIGGAISSGTRIGLKISNGVGQHCTDKHPPDGDDVVYTPGNGVRIRFKVTGDALSGISCHFQKDS